MGLGDKMMAIGDAWALHQADPAGRRVAIGDGERFDKLDLDLTWGLEHFLVPKDALDCEEVLWVHSRPSQRPYHDHAAMRAKAGRYGVLHGGTSKIVRRLGHYIFNMEYRAKPAPIKLKPQEEDIVAEWREKGPFVVLEPYIKASAPPNKQWAVERYHSVAKRLSREVPVYQIGAPDRAGLAGLPQIQSDSYRHALAYLKASSLFIGPEGGLHHGAAAMDTKAVVIFGGFTPPSVTGYDTHVNLTGDAGGYYCGTRYAHCPHCQQAMNSITVDEVVAHSMKLLKETT